jgi:hypothetical protein
VLVKGYRETLKLPEDAWDVFLLYPPGVTWEGERPPAPAYWMHQLGSRWLPRVQGPYFDAGAFLQRTRELLARPVASAQE